MNNEKLEKANSRFNKKIAIFLLMFILLTIAAIKKQFFDKRKKETNFYQQLKIINSDVSLQSVHQNAEKSSNTEDEINAKFEKQQNEINDLKNKIIEIESESLYFRKISIEDSKTMIEIKEKIANLELYEKKSFKLSIIFSVIDSNIMKIKEKINNGGNISNELENISEYLKIVNLKSENINRIEKKYFIKYQDFVKNALNLKKTLFPEYSSNDMSIKKLYDSIKYFIISNISIKYKEKELIFPNDLMRDFYNFKKAILNNDKEKAILYIDLISAKKENNKEIDEILEYLKNYVNFDALLNEVENIKLTYYRDFLSL